jgi:hypothetical protein
VISNIRPDERLLGLSPCLRASVVGVSELLASSVFDKLAQSLKSVIPLL